MAVKEDYIIKKVTFWEFLIKVFKKKQVGLTKAATEESASVRALKKHINTLEEINDQLEVRLRSQAKALRDNDQRNMEEKLIDGAIQIFSSSSTPNQHQNTKVEGEQKPLTSFTGVEKDLSDEEINTLLDSAPKDIINTIPTVPNNMLKQEIAKQGLNVTDKTVIRAKELARAKAS